jgi:hypothetical protein
MLTQTHDVSTSFLVVSEKPDKLGHPPVVLPATSICCSPRRPLDMSLLCLGECGHLAEDRDSAKILLAIITRGYLYE